MTETCENCKHRRPIRGESGYECGHKTRAGLIRCQLCGIWETADKFVLRVTAKKVACPECLGLNEIPRSDSNLLGGVRPDWCPGFESGIEPQGFLF